MKSAVDSSIVLDILLDDSDYADGSVALLERYLREGPVMICPIAYCESAASLVPSSRFSGVSRRMGLIYDDFDPEVCARAAEMWRDYRRQGGPRQRVLADFLIGAHALVRAECLLSRDRGFFRKYFQGLKVASP